MAVDSELKAAFDSRALVGGGVAAVAITAIADRLAALKEMEQIMHVSAPTIALVLCLIVAALSTPAPAKNTLLVVKVFRWPALTVLAALSLWATCGGANATFYNGLPPDIVSPAAAQVSSTQPGQWWPPPTPGARTE